MDSGRRSEGAKVFTFEMKRRGRRRSLHEFICREINPRLERGWVVSDVRIHGARVDEDTGCRMDIVLVREQLSLADAAP
jgi:hypothetical protein